jgi:hypothetical protein
MNMFWEEVFRQGYSYIAYEKDYTTRHLQFANIPSEENTPDWIKLKRLDTYDTDLVAAYKIEVLKPPFPDHSLCTLNDQQTWGVSLPAFIK